MTYSATALAAMLDGLQSVIDAGPQGASLVFLSASGDEQATIHLPLPCGTRTGTSLTLDLPLTAMRTGGDPITQCRLQAAVELAALTVTATGGGGQIELDSTIGYPGGSLTLTAGTIGF